MSMHLEGPWLSTTGKRRGKQKFRSAEEAQRARELAESWENLQKKYAPVNKIKTKAAVKPWTSTPSVHVRDTGPRPPSLPDTVLGAVASRQAPRYTGTLIKGIATMHKSNAVPIINDEQAVEVAHMRR